VKPNICFFTNALGLRSPSLDSALRASLRLSKIAPGDFVAALTANLHAAFSTTYVLFVRDNCISFAYFVKLLKQPMAMCTSPGTPSRNPRRRK